MAGRLHDDEVHVDADLVRALLARQFPQWAGLPLRRVASTGTDNVIFRLGDELAVRMPRIHWAVGQIAKEFEWLPVLAEHLPAAVAAPVGHGKPDDRYPYPWLVYRWLDGVDALSLRGLDWDSVVVDVAAFLTALRRVDTAGAPTAGARAGPLAPHDEGMRVSIARMQDELEVDRATAVWEAALAADPWPGPPVWVHADLLPGNLLVRDGRLVGVIDWAAAGVGDPACDAMLAWSLPPDARAAFRSALAIDDATWARARGWSLQQAVQFIPYYADTIPDAVAAARRRVGEVLADSRNHAAGDSPW